MMRQYIRVVRQIIAVDLVIFRQGILARGIDLSIWLALTLIVAGYVLPSFGMSQHFGVFQLCGILSSIGLFEVYPNVMNLISDIHGDRIISYYLTLPLPSRLVFAAKVIYWCIASLLLTVLVIPLGVALLWGRIDMHQLQYGKLFVAVLCANIFTACFTLFVVSITPSLQRIGSVWMRLIFPLWFMGGFQFSWYALYQTVPWLAYIDLINPMIYVTESTRVAVMGTGEYMDFWLSIFLVCVFSVASFGVGVWRLSRRLDCV